MSEGRINAYTCFKCGRKTITVDRVSGGVTPFVISCPWCEGGDAQSSFYRVPQDLDPTHEWYSPDEAELGTLLSFPEGQDVYDNHIKKGGLVMRVIGGESFTSRLMAKLEIGQPDYSHCCSSCESSCTSAAQTIDSEDESTYLKIVELSSHEGPCLYVYGCHHCETWHVLLQKNAADLRSGRATIAEQEESLWKAVEHAISWADILNVPALIEAGRKEYAVSQCIKVLDKEEADAHG
jgi:hypothetical protein